MLMPSVQQNNPNKKGQLASQPVLFGDCSRYKVAAVHTRFDTVEWFVWDAELTDDITGLPSVIRQEDSFEEAIKDFI